MPKKTEFSYIDLFKKKEKEPVRYGTSSNLEWRVAYEDATIQARTGNRERLSEFDQYLYDKYVLGTRNTLRQRRSNA